jgi:imidazole glycerol-phosphate synthase subunit HisH
MIVIIDYNMGNVGSIANMIKHIGGESIITKDPKEIEKAKKIILPGVGSFDTGMENLLKYGLIDVLNHMVLDKKVITFGICLGMQLLSKRSQEGALNGLGWIEAETIKFEFPEDIKLNTPHMGWNDINVKKGNEGILKDLPEDPRFYFDHSYHLECKNEKDVMAYCEYGYAFPCAVYSDNIYGVQFHPEKSHKYGMKVFENFINL